MNKLFNINIDDIIADYKISYQNKNDNFINQINRLNNNVLKVYTHKVNEHNKILKQLSDVKNEINASQNKLHDIIKKVEHEEQILQSETNRMESNDSNSRLLEVEENNLQNTIHDTKAQLTQMRKEKKVSIKKVKKEIDAFRTGVNKYEQFLQLTMNINNEGLDAVIEIIMKNINNSINYNIILKENEEDFILIDVTPTSQAVIKGMSLYNQNKDIQGLLAFLFLSEE